MEFGESKRVSTLFKFSCESDIEEVVTRGEMTRGKQLVVDLEIRECA